jgi:heme exporter protein A
MERKGTVAGVDAIKLSHIGKTFGNVRAVVDVTLELPRASVVVIEGPNGSGKSTLLGIVGTLIRPTSGSIDYGFAPSMLAVRTRLGWLGHDTLCYPDLTGRENIELAARLAGVDAGSAWKRCAERFAIGDFGARPMRTASRGQRQRVALARALLHEPELVLLDEPTTGLDKASVQRVEKVLEEEAARGATVVMVTHDAKIAQSMKTIRYQMDRGRLKPGLS